MLEMGRWRWATSQFILFSLAIEFMVSGGIFSRVYSLLDIYGLRIASDIMSQILLLTQRAF